MSNHRLELCRRCQHSCRTRGQSRGGGLVPSNSERRSKQFGRVAVAYVQGPPKGGGALGSLKGTNTRLCRRLRTEGVLMHIDRPHRCFSSIGLPIPPQAIGRRAGR